MGELRDIEGDDRRLVITSSCASNMLTLFYRTDLLSRTGLHTSVLFCSPLMNSQALVVESFPTTEALVQYKRVAGSEAL